MGAAVSRMRWSCSVSKATVPGPHPKLSQSEVPGIHGPTGPRRMLAGEEQGLVPPWLGPQDVTDHSAQLSRPQVANRHQAAAAGQWPLHH